MRLDSVEGLLLPLPLWMSSLLSSVGQKPAGKSASMDETVVLFVAAGSNELYKACREAPNFA